MKIAFAKKLLFMLLASLLFLSGCDVIKDLFSKKDDTAVKQTYMEYRKAMQAGDIESLKKLLSKLKVHELDSPQAKQMLELARSLYPQNVAVTGVNVQGDAATLSATASEKGGSLNGTVHLIKEDGVWKVYDEQWEMKMGMQQEQPITQPAPPLPDNKRPYEYHKIVGIWKGKEAGASSGEWTFTLNNNYDISVDSPAGHYYSGNAVSEWDLGIEGSSLMVLRGGTIFDVKVTEAQNVSAVGKFSLGSYKLMGDVLQICLGEPGLMKRTSDFASSGGIRCFELRKTQDLPAAPVPEMPPAQQPAQTASPSTISPSSKGDPGVTGEAIIVKDGKTETYPLVTGFFSETRFKEPAKATIQFQVSAPEHSNARRIEITLNATKTGTHHAEGNLLRDTFMPSDAKKLNIGEYSSQGYTASFRWVADGGQLFFPKTSCTITITLPYTGTPNSVFAGEVNNCAVHSAGIDYNISSVKFVMRGAPSR